MDQGNGGHHLHLDNSTNNNSIHRRRRRRPSIPSALHIRSLFTPRPPPPLLRFARQIYCAQPHAQWNDISSTLLTNQHATFADVVASSRHIDSIKLLNNDQCSIVSPHVGAINSLDFDNGAEGRFLLAGGADGTISVYDVGLDGSEYYLDGGLDGIEGLSSSSSLIANTNQSLRALQPQKMAQLAKKRIQKLAQHKPLARSHREPPASSLQNQHDPTYVPSGHGASISTVQWYPVDTGAFVSTDKSGQVLIWDTNTFVPVSSVRLPGSIRCADMVRDGLCSHTLLAVGIAKSPSGLDRSVRLCDLRSGSASHELVGHGPRGGINAVRWSSVDEFCLCSGGEDATIRFWDIRKSGSGACLGVLDRESSGEEESEECGNASSSYGSNGNKRQKTGAKRTAALVGPSDYSAVEARHIQSHGGPITSLSFTPDGATLVSTGLDRRVTAWDVHPPSGRYRALPTTFLGPDEANPHPIDVSAGRRVAATIVQPGSTRTATLWISGPGCSLLAYGVHGPGGRPDAILFGHLDGIRAVSSHDNTLTLYTGGMDGMILAWGCPTVEGTDDAASDYFARLRQRRRRRGTTQSFIQYRSGFDAEEDVDNW